MSLKIAAEHLKSQGRGQDTELIHMTPGEIRGLQQLAEAHGGSLTINPHTGLPEAGFLSNLLPTIIGAGVGIATGNPFLGAAIGGGLGYATSGNLMSGLMSGMGAWGGTNFINDLAASAPAGAAAASTAGAAPTTTAGMFSAEVPQGVNAFVNPASTGIAGSGALDASALASGAVPDAVAKGLYPNFAGSAAAGAMPATDIATQVAQQQAAASAIPATSGVGAFTEPSVAGYSGPFAKGAEYAKYMEGQNLGPMDRFSQTMSAAGRGLGTLVTDPTGKGLAFLKENPWTTAGVVSSALGAVPKPTIQPVGSTPSEYAQRLAKYKLSPEFKGEFPAQPSPAYQAVYPNYVQSPYGMAAGGIAELTGDGDKINFMHGDMYPMSQQERSFYATPTQMPTSAQQALASYEPNTNPLTGETTAHMAKGGSTSSPADIPDWTSKDTDPNTRDLDAWTAAKYRMAKLNKRFGMPAVQEQQLNVKGLGDITPADFASGGDVHYNLGGYSDGGRLLKGPGDGMSDDIPATIGAKQPARLADGEFVVPADVVSHLGNGSTDAGAKHLYNMMDKVRKARTGSKKQGKQIKPEKFIPQA